MKKAIILALLAILVYACTSSDGHNNGNSNSTASDAKPAADGEKIFKTYCVTCHGIYGDMGASGAFNLQKSTLSLEERINVITNGRNTMTPFKDLLSPEKIEAVAKYVETLRK